MLIIVNPHATAVSGQLRELVLYALSGRFEVDAVDTEARGHATELCREAAHEGYDVVVTFGGDGTVNEAANGLLGSATPLCCLPGGSANVFAKMLGIPADHHRRHRASARDGRRLAPAHDRSGKRQRPLLHLLLGCRPGCERRPAGRLEPAPEGAPGRLLLRVGRDFDLLAPLSAPGAADAGARRRSDAIRASRRSCRTARPSPTSTDRPIEVADGAALDSGALAGAVLRRATPLSVPSIAWRALSRRARVDRPAAGHRLLGR